MLQWDWIRWIRKGVTLVASRRPGGKHSTWDQGVMCWNHASTIWYSYCWWFRNPANQLMLVVYPIIYKVLYIPGGAGFLPSTVCFNYISYIRFLEVLNKRASSKQKRATPVFFCTCFLILVQVASRRKRRCWVQTVGLWYLQRVSRLVATQQLFHMLKCPMCR